jgi:hypothetical protein
MIKVLNDRVCMYNESFAKSPSDYEAMEKVKYFKVL